MLKGPEINWGIPHESLGKLFYNAFNTSEKLKTALVDVSLKEFYTYGEVFDYSKNLACHLRNLGICKNDVIGIISENSRKFCVVLIAGFYLATPMHLINPGYTEYEFREILNLSQPKLVFSSKKPFGNLQKIKDEMKFIQNIILLDDDDDENTESFLKFIKEPQTPFYIEESVDFEKHTAIISNSSGTTGMPKGVMQSQEYCRYLLGYARHSDFMGITSGDTVPVILPFFHTYGLFTMFSSLFLGATVVTFDRFQPELYLETIQNYKVQKLFLVPSLLGLFINNSLACKYDLSSVKFICSGGAAVPPTEKALLQDKLHKTEFYEIYACAETGIISKSSNTSTPTGSCGKLSPNSVLKIIDTKSKHTLAVNESGEICFKGSIMTGYLSPETNESVDQEGFFHTGDIGYYDEEGFIYVTGRMKDLIKYKAFQVSPLELEKVLLRHWAVKDVAVVGKPDERVGEVAVAFVVKIEGATVTENDICAHVEKFLCTEKHLHGGVRFIDSIPRNNMGKIPRKNLRDMLILQNNKKKVNNT